MNMPFSRGHFAPFIITPPQEASRSLQFTSDENPASIDIPGQPGAFRSGFIPRTEGHRNDPLLWQAVAMERKLSPDLLADFAGLSGGKAVDSGLGEELLPPSSELDDPGHVDFFPGFPEHDPAIDPEVADDTKKALIYQKKFFSQDFIPTVREIIGRAVFMKGTMKGKMLVVVAVQEDPPMFIAHPANMERRHGLYPVHRDKVAFREGGALTREEWQALADEGSRQLGIKKVDLWKHCRLPAHVDMF